MKRLWIVPLLIAAFAAALPAHAQVPIDCAPSVPCTTSGPSGTGTGDPAYVAFGKTNENFALLPSQLFLGVPLPLIDGGTGATSLLDANIASFTGSITAGHCAEWSSLGVLEDSGVVGCTGSGGGSITDLVSSTLTITNATGPTPDIEIGTGAVTDTLGALSNKPSVGVVCDSTCGNLTLTGLQTIDGQSGVAGTTIALLTAQTTTSQNGPWVEQTGAWTRPAWWPHAGITQAVQFSTYFVRLGTTYAGSVWRQTTAGTVTIDTTAVAFALTKQSWAGVSLGSNLAVKSGVLETSQAQDFITATSYAICAVAPCSLSHFTPSTATTDTGAAVHFNNASAVAVSLVQATTTGYTAGFSFDVQNDGAGTVTIIPATSTIGGASTLTIAQNDGCTITSDGTNYQLSACTAVSAGGSSWSNSASNSNTQALGTGATGTSIVMTNSSAATATGPTNQAWSPATEYCGQGWKTNTTAGSQTVCWQIYMQPVSSTAAPLSELVLAYSVNGGAYTVASTTNESGIVTGAGYYADFTTTAGVCSDCFYQVGANNPGISAGGVEQWSFISTGSTAQTPVYVGPTAFTVTGCGTATIIDATGTTGVFTVGTGSTSCTFTFTVNGATGMTAAHGWVANVDDTTSPHAQHCLNTSTISATTAVVNCPSVVATGDTITVNLWPH